MQRKTMIELTQEYLNQKVKVTKTLKEYVSEYRMKEDEEEQLRNSLLEQFKGKIILLKFEVDNLIHSTVKNIYETSPIDSISYFGVENERIFYLIDSLNPNSKNVLKNTPLDERIEEILSYAMEKELNRSDLYSIMQIRENYELGHSPESEFDPDLDDEELYESRVESRKEYLHRVEKCFNSFLPSFEKVMTHVLEFYPEKFMKESYSSFQKTIVNDKEYYIFY